MIWALGILIILLLACASDEDWTGYVGRKPHAGPYRLWRFREGDPPDF